MVCVCECECVCALHCTPNFPTHTTRLLLLLKEGPVRAAQHGGTLGLDGQEEGKGAKQIAAPARRTDKADIYNASITLLLLY